MPFKMGHKQLENKKVIYKKGKGNEKSKMLHLFIGISHGLLINNYVQDHSPPATAWKIRLLSEGVAFKR